jgi:hypothetical protein
MKAYDSVMSSIIEFWVSMKLARLIKMCLNEPYSEVHIDKHWSENFPIQNGRKYGDASWPPRLWNVPVSRLKRTRWKRN